MPELQLNKLGDPRGRRSEKNDLKVFKFSDEKRENDAMKTCFGYQKRKETVLKMFESVQDRLIELDLATPKSQNLHFHLF